jgi:hypothetical protein
MRDEYVGDIGDFGKYILLNELQKIAGQKATIGINWYYNTRPAPAFRYLSDNNFPQSKNMDEAALLASLQNIHENNRKPRLSDIEEKGIVQGCICYREPIPYSQPHKDRKESREQWFKKSLGALDNADIIFLDPDNGIAPANLKQSAVDAVKYAFIDTEIDGYYNDNSKPKSVILYQHLNRTDPVKFLKWFLDEIQKIKHCKKPIIIIRCPRVTVRYYALIAKTDKHYDLFMKLFKKLTDDYPLLFT